MEDEEKEKKGGDPSRNCPPIFLLVVLSTPTFMTFFGGFFLEAIQFQWFYFCQNSLFFVFWDRYSGGGKFE